MGLITWLLLKKGIKAGHYVFLFTVIVLASLALYGFDRLKEIDLKNLRLILNEIKEVKKDVYAKAETVKKLGEELAELTVFNITTVGRYGEVAYIDKKMLEGRDKINMVLSEVGSDDAKIKKLSSEIEEKVLFDLKNEIYKQVEKITYDMVKEGKQINRDEIINKVRELLKNYNGDLLVKYLEEEKVYKEELMPLLDKVDRFIKDKKL